MCCSNGNNGVDTLGKIYPCMGKRKKRKRKERKKKEKEREKKSERVNMDS